MSTYNFLDTEAIISNKDTCCRILRDNCKELNNKTERQIAMAVNGKYSPKNDIYLDINLHLTSLYSAHYRLMYTGFNDADNNKLYLSCCKNRNNNWGGAFTGTLKQIIDNVKETNVNVDENSVKTLQKELQNSNIKETLKDLEEEPKNSDEEEKAYLYAEKKANSLDNPRTKEFYTLLYNRLLVQKGWELETTALRSYIDVVIARLNFMLQDNEDVDKYLTYNGTHTMALFNTALLDKFGKPILVTSAVRGKSLSFTDLRLVDTKATLLQNDFDKEQIKQNLDRVDFVKTREDLMFNAEIDDFDLCNYERLTHCIVERRDRFPEYTKNMSDDAICTDMVKAIEMGITLSKYDLSYIKPIYNCRYNQINFIIPYHIGNDFNKEPELGIVVTQFDNGLWEVMTILRAEECKQDERTLNLYSDNSL